ncbi:MAG: hypothetical protein QXO37_09090 [Candidatus Nitrosocaldaceae archaeon]
MTLVQLINELTLPSEYPDIEKYTIFGNIVDIREDIEINGIGNIINGLNSEITFTGDDITYIVTIKNTHFKNVKFTLASSISLEFQNCSFISCTFAGVDASVISFKNCIIDLCKAENQVNINIIDSICTNSMFTVNVNVYTDNKISSVTACTFTNVFIEGTIENRAFLTDVQGDTLNVEGYAVITNAIFRVCNVTSTQNSINNLVLNGSNVLLSFSGADNSIVSAVALRNESGTNNSALMKFDNCIDIAITGITVSNASTTARPLFTLNNCQRIQVIGSGLANNITAGSATSSSTCVIMINPLTYTVATYTAGSSQTSHTINTGLLGTITHLFVQGRNIASNNYNSLSVSGNQFTIGYSSATTANIHYEAWSAVY